MEPSADAGSRTGGSGRTELWLLIAVAAVALAVRLVYLAQSADNPTFARPVVDAGTYHRMARNLVARWTIGDEFFWQPFFYPFFLAVAYGLSGVSIVFAKVAQCVVGSGTCVLTYLLGRRIFGRRAGLIAAGIVAFYGPLIFFDTELLAAGWAALWCVLAVLLFVKVRQAGSARGALALGLVGALAVITRPVFLPAMVAGWVWLAACFWREGRRRLVGVVAARIVAGFALIVAPVAGLAWWRAGRLTFLPSSGGINFYIGNNPDAPATLTIRPGWRWRRLTEEPIRHGWVDQWQQQRYFHRRALEYATSQPGDFAAGLGRKSVQFVNSREIPRNVDVYMFRRWSSLLRGLVWKAGRFGFPFGVLLPLAAMGLALCGRRMPAVVWLFLLAYAGAVVLVFVAGRYRVPVIPLFAVLAGGGCVAAGQALRRRNWRRLAVGVMCAAVAATVAAAPGAFLEEKCSYEGELHLYLGSYHQFAGGDRAGYIGHLTKAKQLMPDNSDVDGELGFVCLEMGDVERAVEHLTRAVTIEPGNFIARHNLGNALAMQKKFDQAIAQYARALEGSPRSEQTHYNLAQLLARRGETARAVDHYAAALRINPGNLKARYALAQGLMKLGRDAEAVAHYRKALAEADDFHAARAGLAWVLATSADPAVRNGPEALKLASRLAREAPSAEAMDALAAALAEAGRFDDAVAVVEQVLAAAERAGKRELVERFGKRLELYKAGRPMRRGEAP